MTMPQLPLVQTATRPCPLDFDFEEFSHKTLQLFQTFSWAYNYKGIEILLYPNRSKIPEEFIEFCNSDLAKESITTIFHDILHCKEHSSYPSLIRNFIHLRNEVLALAPLSEEAELFCPTMSTSGMSRKNWTPKKASEVDYLSAFLGKLIQENQIDLVVDIGSGLGYLSTNLAQAYGITIMAIESQSDRHTTAKLNDTCPSVLHVNLKLSSAIAKESDPLVQSYKSILVTGLHSCGDLTPWSMNWFLENPRCRVLAIVPCCYHRMNLVGRSPNLPMSDKLKEILSQFPDPITNENSILSYQFCRLASQRSGTNFLNNVGHESRHAFYRAVLELYIQNGNLSLVRTKRKVVKGDPGDFANYVEKTIGAFGGYTITASGSGEFDYNFHRSELLKLYDENLKFYNVTTGLLALQGALQPIAENMILLDRLEYLLQKGNTEIIEVASIKRIIPSNISPRGMVIYAKKKDSY